MVEIIVENLPILFELYDQLFLPILTMGPYAALFVFSAALAGIFSLIYWKFLDIERKNEIKEKLNDKQEKMKEARKNDESEKASEFMQETMKLNQKMMKLNIKPMIVTMLFVALIFPWLSATYSPNIYLEEADDNIFEGEFSYASSSMDVIVDNSTEDLNVTLGSQDRSMGDSIDFQGITWRLDRFGENGGFFSREGVSLRLKAEFIPLPFDLWYIGSALNWLGFYILIAMPLTFIFRKSLGVT